MKILGSRKFIIMALLLVSVAAFAPAVVMAQEAAPAPKLDTGDTAWMIVATAFVMLMSIPGLALFYGGLAKRKDSLNTMAMTFVTFCLASLLWVIFGYSMTFGTDIGGVIGGPGKGVLKGVGAGRPFRPPPWCH